MHRFAYGVALLVALAVAAIGGLYLVNPRSAVQSFGLPLPEAGPNVDSWLRLKGVRDIVAGVVVLAFMAFSGRRELGMVMLIEALIPLGDMSVIVAGKGSRATAFGVHGVTAALMLVAALLLLSSSA